MPSINNFKQTTIDFKKKSRDIIKEHKFKTRGGPGPSGVLPGGYQSRNIQNNKAGSYRAMTTAGNQRKDYSMPNQHGLN